MDTVTERAIQESFKVLCKDRTTLAIAHRITTIEHADLIIVLKEGKIVEQGSWDELLKIGPTGHFYQLWESRRAAEEGAAEAKKEDEPKKEERKERLGGHGGGGHGGGHGR